MLTPDDQGPGRTRTSNPPPTWLVVEVKEYKKLESVLRKHDRDYELKKVAQAGETFTLLFRLKASATTGVSHD